MKTSYILMTSSELQRRPTIWEHLEALIKRQEETLPNLMPIICVHGDCPEDIKEKYEVVLGDPNPTENAEQRYKLVSEAVKVAVASGSNRTLVTKFGTGINNKEACAKNFALGAKTNGKNMYLDCVLCKTDTARRIFTTSVWNPAIDDSKNIYNMFYNVVGNDIEDLLIDEDNLWTFQYFSKYIIRFRNGSK
jgi:hypothetical protein